MKKGLMMLKKQAQLKAEKDAEIKEKMDMLKARTEEFIKKKLKKKDIKNEQ